MLGLALAVRLVFLLTAPPRILWSDGQYYEQIGWQMVSAHQYTGSQFVGPAYPYFIAGVYSVTGRHLFALRLVQVVLSVVAVGAAGAFGAALLSPAAGLLAAALLALHPIIAFLPVTQYIEDLLVLLSVLVFGGFALSARRPSVARWVVLGMLFGLFMLFKSVVGAYLPGLLAGAAIELHRERRWRVRYAAAFAIALGLVLAPWSIRNYHEYDHFILVSGGAEEFLWMANNDEANGWEAGPPEVPQWLEDSLAARPTLAEQNRLYGRVAMDFIRRRPARATELYAIRLANLWSPYPRTVTNTPYRIVAANAAQGAYSVVLYLGLILGVALMVRARRYALLLGAASYLLIAPVFITVLRYRMSMEVILIWTAALGYTEWLRRAGATPSPAIRSRPSSRNEA